MVVSLRKTGSTQDCNADGGLHQPTHAAETGLGACLNRALGIALPRGRGRRSGLTGRIRRGGTHGERLALHEGEFIGGVVAGDGEMVFSRGGRYWPMVRTLTPTLARVAVEPGKGVRPHFFAETDHDAGFCNNGGIDFFWRAGRRREGALVAGVRSGTTR